MLSYSGYQIVAIGVEPGEGFTKMQCLNPLCRFVLSFTNKASDQTIEEVLGAHRKNCLMFVCAWCEAEAGRVSTPGLSHGICDAHSKAMVGARGT